MLYLCAGTHDFRDISFSFVVFSITIEPETWIAARAFIGPGVRVGRGAVIGACSVVLSDVEQATIVVGSPARRISSRVMKEENDAFAGRPKEPLDR